MFIPESRVGWLYHKNAIFAKKNVKLKLSFYEEVKQ
jgi:hypothetical protein